MSAAATTADPTGSTAVDPTGSSTPQDVGGEGENHEDTPEVEVVNGSKGEGIQRFTEGTQRFTEGIQRYLEYPTEDFCGTLNTLQRTSVSSVAARYPTENFCDSPSQYPHSSVSPVTVSVPYRELL